MEWLARWMHNKHGLAVNLQIHEVVESLSENLTVLLFHATRELLFNVIKHSEVMTARVEMTRLNGQIQIEVADDGLGFDPAQLDSTDDLSGIGLFGIRERLRMLGGRLEIESSPGKGSRFRLIAPCSARTAGVMPDLDQPTVSVLMKDGGNEEGEITKKNRIILVDDHIIVRQGLAGLLRVEEGMELVGNGSGTAEAGRTRAHRAGCN